MIFERNSIFSFVAKKEKNDNFRLIIKLIYRPLNIKKRIKRINENNSLAHFISNLVY